MQLTKGTHTMSTAAAALADERVLIDHRPPVIAATGITRRYGEGDTAVDALRGVSLEIARGELTAVMGPSGLGQVDADAHPRRARPPDERQRPDRRRPRSRSSATTALTKLRRRHIGFVFQFFNLLPMLTAEENIAAAAQPSRARSRTRRGSTRSCEPSASPTAGATGPRSCRAASSSASRSPARWSRGRR